MNIITRKNFIPITCMVYTIISMGKLGGEAAIGVKDRFYTSNFVHILLFSMAAVFILSLHSFLQNVPLLPIIIGQYLVMTGLVFLMLKIQDHFWGVEEGGYLDMFLSVTIPYLIGAVIYYIHFFKQIKKANQYLREIKESEAQNAK